MDFYITITVLFLLLLLQYYYYYNTTYRSWPITSSGRGLIYTTQSTLEKNEFVDGETVIFSSLSADPERITTVQDIPKALQINLEGVNSLNQKIINVFIIRFTNGCESLAFEEGT